MSQEVKIIITNQRPEIARANEELTEFLENADVPPAIPFAFDMALDELLTNTISYGYPEGGEHQIIIDASIMPGNITVSITDDGVAFNPLEAPEADTESDLEDRAIGGLGIHLVKQMMDNVEYIRKDERNIITLTKNL
jgi:serine/threonine-protein kinase RsbW